MVRGVVESPVAGQLLHLVAPVDAHVGGHHVHPQAQRGLKEPLVPVQRDVAGLQWVPVGVERPRQEVLVIVEEAAIAEGRWTLREARALQHQRVAVLGRVAGPDVQADRSPSRSDRVYAANAVPRGFDPTSHTRAVGGNDPVALPLTLHGAGIDRGRRLSMAQRHEPDADPIPARRLHDGRPIPADLLDVARQELRGLVHRGVLVVAHDDFAGTISSRQYHVTLGRWPRLNPRPAKGGRPGSRLSRRQAGGQGASASRKQGMVRIRRRVIETSATSRASPLVRVSDEYRLIL